MIYVHSVQRAARYYPDRHALMDGDERLTFRQLHARIRGIAAALVQAGFVRGDRLAILLPNSSEYLSLIYACCWLGVIAVPINVRLAPVEIEHVLADASPRGLVRHSSLPAPKARLPWEVVLDEQPLKLSEEECREPCYDPEAALALIYTSGTTGKPKGVIATHSNILANVHAGNYWIRYREGGVYLHAAPIFHIADLPAIFAAPAFGATQVTLPRFHVQSFCETIQNERVNYTVLVPTMMNLLTQFPDLKSYDLSSLEVLAYGGSAMSPELISRIRAVLQHVKLIQVYGLSETGFLTGLQDHEHAGNRLASCGRPCPGSDVRILGASGAELGPGEQGELIARGANVMRGYWNNDVDTAASFRSGFFHTGDIGYQDAEGYFYILDRLKDMIVTGGENVYCGEVESVLMSHVAVREAAVFGIPDDKWGEVVVACVVCKPGETVTAAALIEYCRLSLANYKIPRRVEVLETDLPKGGSGKILKRVLREHWMSVASHREVS